jgi:hypothetical protein
VAIAAYAKSMVENEGHPTKAIAPTLKSLGDRLETLLRNPNPNFDPATVATLKHCCAKVKIGQYDLAGDDRDLRVSVTLIRVLNQ